MNNQRRVTWDEFFMRQAIELRRRATCNRLKVGAVIVNDEHLQIAEGYNGSISGHSHCEDVGCLINDQGRCIRTIHAEQNALLNAMKKGVSVKDCTIYVTHEPCETCTKLILQSGIKKIYFLSPYDNKYASEFIKDDTSVSSIHLIGSPYDELLESIKN